jgi:probable HAF family extracellular repeat protein
MAYVPSSRRLGLALAAFTGLVWANIATAAVEYSVTELGLSLGASSASAINAGGQVLGNTGSTLLPSYSSNYGYLLNEGTVAQIPTLPAPYDTQNLVMAINAVGQIVGESSTSTGAVHGFLYSNGAMIDLGTLGGASSTANAINDAEQVVGDACTAGGSAHAFLYDDGAMTDMGTLGGTVSDATSINAFGEIVGFSTFDAADIGQHAFIYLAGLMIDLGTLGGLNSEASSVNDYGQVVGYADTDTGQDAFLYSAGVMTDLNSLIDPSSGWTIVDANAINDMGEIAATGYYGENGNFETLLLTPVPEPGAAYLLPLLAAALLRRPALRHTVSG